jgi:outer membrane lipoprotein-sorting protein
MLKNILCLLVALSFLAPGSSFGQQPPSQASDTAATAELISRAAARMVEYRERFKDLTAEETQRVEEFGPEGLKRRPC